MKTREEIIMGMCWTYRFDYEVLEHSEQKRIHMIMSQLFDHEIKPYMEYRGWDEYSGLPAVKDYHSPHHLPVH